MGESVNGRLEFGQVRIMFKSEPSKKSGSMAVPRPTFQQRLFADDELPLQSHDRIVRWVDQSLRNNASPILRSLGIEHEVSGSECVGWGPGTVWADLSGFGHILTSAVTSIGQRYAPPLPTPPAIEILHIGWEPILKDDRGTIIGAVDLAASIRVRIPHLEIFSSELGYKLRELQKSLIDKIPSDRKVLFWNGNRTWIDGKIAEIDIGEPFPAEGIGIVSTREGVRFLSRVAFSAKPDFREFRLYVEAKTKIRSVGELMRQMNLYRSIVKSGSRFLVAAPSNEWDADTKTILHEQGLATVDYLAN